ncbi:MAG TPA: DUF4198 domain-containing protein [Polyangiaceae bacterium]|nr:DUF4198 domain-containing protein [Polyangiaceae bacterium]
MRLSRVRKFTTGWLLAGVPLLLATAAQAHQVWLEQDASGAKLYFGEFGDNLHEASPGYLDKLALISATVLSPKGEKPVESKKDRDGVTITGRAGKGESVIAVDLAYPLLENKEGAKTVRTAWTPAARFVPELGAQQPKLVLDVVPTNASGEFQVVYRGAPLPKAEVSLVAVSGWSLSGTTDDKGKVSFRLPWKGTYALLVRHKDATPGKRKNAQGADEAYDAASFATTLTFATSSGLPSPPAPPAAPPNKP